MGKETLSLPVPNEVSEWERFFFLLCNQIQFSQFSWLVLNGALPQIQELQWHLSPAYNSRAWRAVEYATSKCAALVRRCPSLWLEAGHTCKGFPSPLSIKKGRSSSQESALDTHQPRDSTRRICVTQLPETSPPPAFVPPSIYLPGI